MLNVKIKSVICNVNESLKSLCTMNVRQLSTVRSKYFDQIFSNKCTEITLLLAFMFCSFKDALFSSVLNTHCSSYRTFVCKQGGNNLLLYWTLWKHFFLRLMVLMEHGIVI